MPLSDLTQEYLDSDARASLTISKVVLSFKEESILVSFHFPQTRRAQVREALESVNVRIVALGLETIQIELSGRLSFPLERSCNKLVETELLSRTLSARIQENLPPHISVVETSQDTASEQEPPLSPLQQPPSQTLNLYEEDSTSMVTASSLSTELTFLR